MQLVYLQFDSLLHLKKFTEKFPLKKVFIMLDKQVLLAQLSEKEVDFAIEKYAAEVLSTPVECR
jgi:hypothetical protein